MSTFLLVGEWKHNAMWLEMGMPDISVNFNRVLFRPSPPGAVKRP
jgi:hypothetical protein